MTKKICKKCNQEFNSNSNVQLYCNNCHLKICFNCGLEFSSAPCHNRKYCSKKCSEIAWFKKRPNCIDCGIELKRLGLIRCKSCSSRVIAYNTIAKRNQIGELNSQWKGGISKSICKDCGKQLRGRKTRCWECHLKYRREKPKYNYCINCGAIINRVSIRCKSCSIKFRHQVVFSSTEYPIEFEKKYGMEPKDWIELASKIRKRDKYICQYCGSNGHIIHHIVPRRIKIDNNPNNLITLCLKCHPIIERLTTEYINQGNGNFIEIFRNTRSYKTT